MFGRWGLLWVFGIVRLAGQTNIQGLHMKCCLMLDFAYLLLWTTIVLFASVARCRVFASPESTGKPTMLRSMDMDMDTVMIAAEARRRVFQSIIAFPSDLTNKRTMLRSMNGPGYRHGLGHDRYVTEFVFCTLAHFDCGLPLLIAACDGARTVRVLAEKEGFLFIPLYSQRHQCCHHRRNVQLKVH
mmetsp:Transcript_121069/g.210210  ORF Transcript_121069/g.210210 Transcript_121069/m.210210 type:complete len:186 (-) Transcript_121069:70-627(-)